MLSVRNSLFVVAATACLATPAPVFAALIELKFEPGAFACFDNSHPCTSGISISGSYTMVAFNETLYDEFFRPLGSVNVDLSDLPSNIKPILPNSRLHFSNGASTDILNVTLCDIVTSDGPEFRCAPVPISDKTVNFQYGGFLRQQPRGDLSLENAVTVTFGNITLTTAHGDNADGGYAEGFIDKIFIAVPEPTSLALIVASLGLFFCGYQLKFVQR